MPVPTNLNNILLQTVFGKLINIDQVAKDQVMEFLAYTGMDKELIVMGTPQSELVVLKLKAQIPTTHALASILPAEIAMIACFLRKWNDGTYARFHLDHNHQDPDHLSLLVSQSAVHSFQNDWTPYTIAPTIAKDITIVDAASFRKFLSYLKTNFSNLGYLLEDGPQDNFTKCGKAKDQNLFSIITLFLVKSNLSHTFRLGTDDSETGLALVRKVKAHFLNAQDRQAEIQQNLSTFINTSMENALNVQSFLENFQETVGALEDLGKKVDKIESYTIIRHALSKVDDPLITQCCVTFRLANLNPDESTFDKFVSFLTTDPNVMSFTNKNAKAVIQRVENGGEDGGGSNSTAKPRGKGADHWNNKKEKKRIKQVNKLAAAATMHALYGTSPATSTGRKLDQSALNFVKAERKKWNDVTYGLNSDLRKIFNSHVADDGSVNYHGFVADIAREHQASKSSPTTSYLDAADKSYSLKRLEVTTDHQKSGIVEGSK